jgi:hypothetical protein
MISPILKRLNLLCSSLKLGTEEFLFRGRSAVCVFEQRIDADDAFGVRGGDRRRGGRGNGVAAGDALFGLQRHIEVQFTAWQRWPQICR